MEHNKDFSVKVRKALKKLGVEIYSRTWLPDSSGDFTRGETGYLLNVAGTSCVRTYVQVVEMAGYDLKSA